MKHTYVHKKFSRVSLQTIANANAIIGEYKRLGYKLTVRQLYYQFVATDLFPNDRRWTWTGTKWIRDINGTKNAEPNYKWLIGLVNDARWAGLIDWDDIEDRLRDTVFPAMWETPRQIMQAAVNQYREDLWDGQPWHVDVMSEKDAVSNILEPICRRLGVHFTANRGYPSASLLYSVANRLNYHASLGQDIAIIYLGDHDPSGLDMDRDIVNRLELLSEGVFDFELKRIALVMPQIKLWNPPEDPAKKTDSRWQAYVVEHGNSSWELDSIKAPILDELLTDTIEGYIEDHDLWEENERTQSEHHEELRELTNSLKE